MAKAGIVYVGTDDGLAIYSDPGGSGRWRRVGHALQGCAILSIETQDALNLTVAVAEMGAQQSSDGGQNWQPAPEEAAVRLAVAAPSPGAVNVATARGLMQRKIAGAADATALAALAGNQETLLAATAGGVLSRSDDGGATWQPAAVAVPLDKPIVVIMPARYHMDTAWAGAEDGRLLRSDDRGRTWEQIAQEPAAIRSLAVVRLA